MHHFLSRPDWLDELNADLAERKAILGLPRGPKLAIPFEDFVLVENDWATGRETDVKPAQAVNAEEHA